jgi:hypothetical protein
VLIEGIFSLRESWLQATSIDLNHLLISTLEKSLMGFVTLGKDWLLRIHHGAQRPVVCAKGAY